MATIVTKTIRSSGGDYTSLANWESAQQGDLVSADEVRVAECYDDWPSGAGTVTIDGSTTDSTRYMKITVAEGHRHDGIDYTSGFWIANGSMFASVVLAGDDYTFVDGVAGAGYTTGSFMYGFGVGAAQNVTFKNCFLHNVGGYLSSLFSVTGGAGTTRSATFINCLAIDTGGQNCFVIGDPADNSAVAYNCVAVGGLRGFSPNSGTTLTVKNCVAYNNTTNWYGTYNAASTNNATSSGSDDAPGGSSVYGVTSAAFANAAGNNFHLSGASSVLHNVGADLSGIFTTDIDGQTWVNWSIGFDQIFITPQQRAYGPDGQRMMTVLRM